MLTILQPTSVISESRLINCDNQNGDFQTLARIFPGVDVTLCTESEQNKGGFNDDTNGMCSAALVTRDHEALASA